MKIGLIAMSGVRVKSPKMIELGVTLPQFVSRGKVIAQLPSLALLILASLTPEDIEVDYVEIGDVKDSGEINRDYDLVAISSYTGPKAPYCNHKYYREYATEGHCLTRSNKAGQCAHFNLSDVVGTHGHEAANR